jgi:hypothetical protein
MRGLKSPSFSHARRASQKEIFLYVRVHLINPSDSSFGIGVISPRWLYVLAAATPAKYGDPIITDETLEQLHPDQIQPGDAVGIGIHTGNALRGKELGAWRANAARMWFTGASMRRFIRKRRSSSTARTFGAPVAIML